MRTKMAVPPSLRSFYIMIIASSFLCKCHGSFPSQACATSYCGFQPIKYPFGISGQGCGHPRFQIECVQDFVPVITIGKQRFRIKDLFYGDPEIYAGPKIWIVDEKMFMNPCDLPGAGVDLNGTPFSRAPPFSNLALFLGCTNISTEDINIRPVQCNSTEYLCLNDPKCLEKVRPHCNPPIQIPITLGDDFNAGPLDYLNEGFELQWKLDDDVYQQQCRLCESTGGLCGFNTADSKQPFLCHCPHGVHPNGCYHDGKGAKPYVWVIAVSGIGGILLVAAAVLFAAFWFKRRNPHPSNQSLDSECGSQHIGDILNDTSSNSVMKIAGSDFPVMFNYKELQQATHFFDRKRKLGTGSFGSVYLGTLGDGRTVAVKRLHEYTSRRVAQFVNEVNILSSVCHPNLVRLYGCYQDHQNLLLVYEYVPNGTLADHLHGEKKGKGLLWEARLNIALETARALAFLHFHVEPPIFHRDVKSTNILLDENLRVKVADFGLSRLIPGEVTHVSTAPQGTPGYLDPDYHQCYQLTDKSDVYSFGVVLAEIISGKEAVDITRDRKEISLANLAISKIQTGALNELVDPQLGFEYNPLVKSMVTGVAELAFRCLASQKDDRPSMIEIVSQLQRLNHMGYGFVQSNLH